MVVWCVWYNPKTNSMYLKDYTSVHSLNRVGYINQYGHMVVCNYVYYNGEFLQPFDTLDYYRLQKPKPSFKDKAINRVIDLLIDLKKR